MKCPKCHKEVEKGSLYCPHCLAEDPVGQGVRFCRNTDEETAAEKARKREKENRIQAEKTWKKTDHPAAYSSSGHSGCILLQTASYIFGIVLLCPETV